VDSYRPQVASDWAANGDLPTLEETDPQIAAYFQGVLAREHRSGACHELGDNWIAHAQVRNRAWTFIAVLQHGR